MATLVGTARAEDPGLSGAREAADAMPPERVRRNVNQPFLGLLGQPLYLEIIILFYSIHFVWNDPSISVRS